MLASGRGLQLRMLALAAAAMFASGAGQTFVIAVFVDDLLADTDLTRTTFSALYGAATVVSATAMIVLGRLADRVTTRVVWAVVAAGLAASCGLASLVQGALVAFVALSLLRTFGQGAFPLVATIVVNRWFTGRRGQAMATASFGFAAALVTLPPITVALVVALEWRDAFRALGLGVLLLVLPLALLARDPHVPLDGDAEPVAARRLGPRAFRRARRLRVELPTRRAARLLFVLSAVPLAMTALIFHSVSLLDARGLSFAQAGLVLSVVGVLNAAGTIAGGAIADRVSTSRLLALMSGSLAGSAILLLVDGRAAAFAGYALLGVAGGLFAVASGIVWGRTYGIVEIGRLQGASFFVQIGSAALGPLTLAASATLAGGYAPGLVALAVYSAATLVVAARWRDPRAVRSGRLR